MISRFRVPVVIVTIAIVSCYSKTQSDSSYWSWLTQPHVDSRVVRIDPLHFLAGCRKRRLSYLLAYVFFSVLLFISALLCMFISHCYVFSLLVVLVKFSVLAKSLARKTPLRKPSCGEGIFSVKPRPKSVCDFLGLYCFIV